MRALKIVVISSLDGGVGKTTISSALGVEKGMALLVDMDWEKADLSQLFRAPRKPGWLAPFLKGTAPYLHRVNPMLYVMPGYEAYEIYQREGEDAVSGFSEALLEWVEFFPKFVAKLRIPVDVVILDTPAALRTEILAKLQHMGAYNIFVADRRLISRISDIKSEQYRRYLTYSSLAVVNMLEKDELKMAKKIAPVTIRRVKIREYYGEAIANDLLRERENKKSIDQIITRIKTA
ncbi:ATPases involved in chromosome partitioning [Pyrobaculum oguniense TE7]|uniref:ATPases involved in chromosome partitioning n=1 Tax=Pyrobaculum oguniense (strain DSM 13380 / JCM 10595 / TE7) TaxID=698757 RepID=H6Q837_PYROT|nr:ATPases involved in chromosome partitioning [Pyrobaculum oguniense TE7]